MISSLTHLKIPDMPETSRCNPKSLFLAFSSTPAITPAKRPPRFQCSCRMQIVSRDAMCLHVLPASVHFLIWTVDGRWSSHGALVFGAVELKIAGAYWVRLIL